jgi:hypothetical protein
MVTLVTSTLKYGISEVNGWVVVSPSGKAENNEPLRVRHLFRRWLAKKGVRVIVNLQRLENFGVWEVGVLTSLANVVDTLVILMGLHNLRKIMGRLLAGGCAPERPVALIQSGTYSLQKTLVGSVRQLLIWRNSMSSDRRP